MKMKNDKYRRARGGSAQMLNLYCSNCAAFLLLYQKDGPGSLMRCYLNRIFRPSKLEKLQSNPEIKEPNDLPPLKCSKCHNVVGTPMRYTDGRLAYRLLRGTFSKQLAEGQFE